MAYSTDIGVPARPSRLWGRLATPFALLVLAHGAVAVAMGQFSGYPFRPGMAGLLAMVLGILTPWFLLVLLIRRAVLLAVVDHSTRPVADMLAVLLRLARDRERLLMGALNLGLAAFFIGASGYLKEMIPYLHAFSWDQSFAHLDRMLSFGTDPWRLLMPLFGSSLAVTSLNVAYHAWFFIIYFIVFVACFARPGDKNAMAFLCALVLVFGIGGNGLAVLFSSAGPVYYERLGFGTDFAPLMAHLHEVAKVSPVWALDVQEELWKGYVADGKIAGISAMPSMHVATSVLMALYARTHARWAGWALGLFAVSIMIGSVVLGWHYAVDGYFGALIAWLSWRGGILLVNR